MSDWHDATRETQVAARFWSKAYKVGLYDLKIKGKVIRNVQYIPFLLCLKKTIPGGFWQNDFQSFSPVMI